MGVGSTAKRRRTGTDSSANSATPSRAKAGRSGRGRGRPPNAPRDGRERPPPLPECFRRRCTDVLDRLNKKDHLNIFLEPVNTDEVDGYAETIKRPMDLTTMRTKLGKQSYRSLGEFRRDLDLIWSNCLLFNGKEPTNIFSRTAIELRRLTEKLIASTRQHLEKDKENIIKWKEKHRRRRETMQANAVLSAHGLHPQPGVGPGGYAGRDSRTNVPGRDPMDSTATTFPREEHNGRTPEENALADHLRLQYAGTTGLYRKGTDNVLLPQYATADGSLVQIPLRKYHPTDRRWEDGMSGEVSTHQVDACPGLLCETLPLYSTKNPCAPQPRKGSILVKDYAQSLYRFVQNSKSTTTTQIVTELLSPELAVKKQQEEFLKKGLTLHDLAMMASKANARNVSDNLKAWDTKSIIQLADAIDKANRKVVSILPKLKEPRHEMNGIDGLRQLLGEDIAKEVDTVPVDVVDFSMPHGVSVATMDEIARLQNAPALGIAAKDLQCIDSLHKQVLSDAHRRRASPAGAMDTGSNFTPAQLHEIQLRSLGIKQQLCTEAHRQANIIEQRKHMSSAHHPNNVALHKRELQLLSQKRQRSGVTDGRSVMRPAHHNFSSQSSVQSQEMNNLLKARAQQAAVAAAKAASLDAHQNHAASNRGLSHSVGIPSHRTSHELPPANQNSICNNCGTRDQFGWRAGGLGPEGVERLCIPCGLYWEKTHRNRPKELWGQTSHRTSRTPSNGSFVNSVGASRGLVNASPMSSPHATPNGVAKRPIQKPVRVMQSSPRHSSSSVGSRGIPPNARVSVGAMGFPPGVQSAHGGQHLVSAHGDMRGMHQQGLRAQMPSGMHMYSGQGTSSNGVTVVPSQAIQAMHGVGSGAFTNVRLPGVSGSGRTNVNTRPGAQAQMKYRRQPQGGGLAPHQQFTPLRTQGQQNLVAHQGDPLMQQKLMNQQLGGVSAGVGMLRGENQTASQRQQPKNAPMMNMNGGVHNIPGSSQFSAVQQSGLGKSADQRGGTANVTVDRGQRNNLSDAGSIQTALDFSNLSSFGNQGGMGLGIGSGLGDVGARSTFANSGSLSGDVMGSDQIGDMFFADGALETPSGGPEFSF